MLKKIRTLILFLLFANTLSAQTQLVTLQVSSPDSTPVFAFGSWTSFGNWPGNAMTNLGNNTWSITLPLASNTTYEYLFVNGTTPYAKEILNPTWPCTNGNATYTNRVLNLGNADTALCATWATCNSCTIIPPPANVIVSFQVENPDSLPVYVFGSWTGFGNWPGDLMTDANSDGIYDVNLTLPSNATYEFLYVNGVGPTKEVLDPAWPCTNGNGQYTNRVLNVGNANLTSCNIWALCDTCGAVVTPTVTVDFIVENPDSTPVYLFGNWNGFSNWPGTIMTPYGANAYKASLNLPQNSAVEYLFVNGNTSYAKEVLDPSWPCTNGNSTYTNRLLNIGSSNLIACNKWALCDPCSFSGISENSISNYSLKINSNALSIISEENELIDGIIICDLLGRVVFEQSIPFYTNTNLSVNLSNDSIYVVSIKSQSGKHTFKSLIRNQ